MLTTGTGQRGGNKAGAKNNQSQCMKSLNPAKGHAQAVKCKPVHTASRLGRLACKVLLVCNA